MDRKIKVGIVGGKFAADFHCDAFFKKRARRGRCRRGAFGTVRVGEKMGRYSDVYRLRGNAQNERSGRRFRLYTPTILTTGVAIDAAGSGKTRHRGKTPRHKGRRRGGNDRHLSPKRGAFDVRRGLVLLPGAQKGRSAGGRRRRRPGALRKGQGMPQTAPIRPTQRTWKCAAEAAFSTWGSILSAG